MRAHAIRMEKQGDYSDEWMPLEMWSARLFVVVCLQLVEHVGQLPMQSGQVAQRTRVGR